MKSKTKISNTAFFLFTACLGIAGAIITILGVSAFLSGEALDSHSKAIAWRAVLTLIAVATFALLRILADFVNYFYQSLKGKKGNTSCDQEE